MFESKDKLRIMELENEVSKLQEDCRWYRHGNDVKSGLIEKLCEENRKLKRDIEELEYRELSERKCACGCCEKYRKSDDRMTLGEFDKEMRNIAFKHDLDYVFHHERNERTYRFTNPRNGKYGLSLHCHTHCGWAEIVVDINDFAVRKSELRNIENSIVENCL